MSFRSDPLREYLREVFQSAHGTGYSFLADPVFEASFGWRPAEDTLGDLSGRPCIHPDVVKALDKPPKAFAEEYTFPPNNSPISAVRGWKTLIEARPAAFGVSEQRHRIWQD